MESDIEDSTACSNLSVIESDAEDSTSYSLLTSESN